MKLTIRWSLIIGFLGLIWGTHLITTTSSYLTSQEVLRQHARDIMKNIAELAVPVAMGPIAKPLPRRRKLADRVAGSAEPACRRRPDAAARPRHQGNPGHGGS